MRRLWLAFARTAIWPWSRHHHCTVCGLPRPIWCSGDHTGCLIFELRRLRELDERERGRQRPQTLTCPYANYNTVYNGCPRIAHGYRARPCANCPTPEAT